MTTQTIGLGDDLSDYMREVSVRERPVLARLRRDTARLENAHLQIAPEQGQFLSLLVELIGARRVLEIGTFTGYSALAMALALPEGGRLVTCDLAEDYTLTARRYWAEAGVTNRIDLRLAPAIQTLDGLIAEGQRGRFDLAFIDADKENYSAYYERCLTLLRPGGLIVADNVLWGGAVIDPDANDVDTQAIRNFNARLADDERVSVSLVPIGDGLFLARKRA